MATFNPNGQQNEIPADAWNEPNVNFGKLPGVFGFIGGIMQTLLQQALNDRATDKQNSYNAPSAQMQRLKQAGINPYSAYAAIGGQNTSAPRQAAQIRFQEAVQNTAAILQMQALKEDVRGKQLNNDILSNNLQFQRSQLENRQKAESLRIQEQNLRNLYLSGQLSIQDYQIELANLRKIASDMFVSVGDANSWSSTFFQSLKDLGFENVPEKLSIGQIDAIVDMLSRSLNFDYLNTTYQNRVDISGFQRNILEKNFEMIQEQLEHLKSVNDKYEKWFLFNQIVGAASQILSVFGVGVNAASGIQHMIFNPYNPNGAANQ